MKRTTMVGSALLLTAGVAHAGLIDPNLDQVMRDAAPGEAVSALIYLSAQVDLPELTTQLDAERATLAMRHEVVVRALQDMAAVTQGDILAQIEAMKAEGRLERFQAFHIGNIIRVDGQPEAIRELGEHVDVDQVYLNYEIESVRPVVEPGALDNAPMTDGAVEPGVEAVRAPEVWALGITGEGVLVATLDTGVDGNHPALASRWRGLDPRYASNPEWAWFDPVTNTTFPQAFGSHGTHTMGSVLGGAPGDQIGVAPGAQWIHAATIDRVSIPQTVADSLAAFQWMLDPDGNPQTNWDVPAVCSNSWGLVTSHGYPPCDETFWAPLDASEAAGTLQTFSAGNEGSSGLRRPADRATDDYRTMAVAAVDANITGWPIASFSSRGPTTCTPNGSSAIKPDIAAPGVSVRSSLPGGGYGNNSGTSMASPHVNGVVALIRQANPDITIPEIKQAIYDTAFDLGTSGEDNSYGWGMIDAFEAVQLVFNSAGIVFEFPDGRPEFIDPAGGATIRVVVVGTSGVPEPGTGRLYYSSDGGSSFTEVAMDEVSDNTYDAVFPAFDCGARVDYYFSARNTEGQDAFSPPTAPDTFYSGDAYTGVQIAFQDDFETDTGWTVVNENLEDGPWERAVPAGGGARGDPAADADGSGNCYVTDNEVGNSDVDGGPTRLISPVIDATGLDDPVVRYARWFTNDDQDADRLVVEISNNGGNSWAQVESVQGGGGWVTREVRISDFFPPNDQIRLRFSATDNPNDSVTEAGLDAFELISYFCEEGCTEDLDGSGAVDFGDVQAILAAWGNAGGPEDLDGSGTVDFGDVLVVLAAWGEC